MSLSNYASGLSIEAKTRYLGKLQMINSDCPYCIPNSLWKHGLDCCPIVICADNNCKRKTFHESCIKSQTNPPKRITKLWKCDTCKKAARAAAAKAKKNNLPVVPSNSKVQRTALSNITNQ